MVKNREVRADTIRTAWPVQAVSCESNKSYFYWFVSSFILNFICSFILCVYNLKSGFSVYREFV